MACEFIPLTVPPCSGSRTCKSGSSPTSSRWTESAGVAQQKLRTMSSDKPLVLGTDQNELGTPGLPPLPRECNDNGDYGICTHCDNLHTATILGGCKQCGNIVTHELDLYCLGCQGRMQSL